MASGGVVNSKCNAYDGIYSFCGGGSMTTEDEWADRAKRLLRAEMVKRGITYEELAEKLAEIGVEETAVNIRNKVARGKFMASFLLQCLQAIGVQIIRLEDV